LPAPSKQSQRTVPTRSQLVAGSAAIFTILTAVAFNSMRPQDSNVVVESSRGSLAVSPSLVQASERGGVDPKQAAQESTPAPTLPARSSAAMEPESPSILPRVPNDPLTSSFVAESQDPSWSDFTEAQILGEISRLSGLALVTIDVECRTSLCRVQSAFPTTDARARQRILGVAALSLEPRPVVAVANKSGNVMFLAYFGRPKTPTTRSQP
jgi:hypothetical protein